MPTDNRPPRKIRITAALILIFGRYIQAVHDADTTMQSTCKSILKSSTAMLGIYDIEDTSWTAEQADAHVACVALCEANELGAVPDCTSLTSLADALVMAVKAVG